MATDELSTPLGQGAKKKRRRFKLPIAPSRIIASLLGLCVAVPVGWALFTDDPLGGEPMAVVSAEARPPAPSEKAAEAPVTPPAATVAAQSPTGQTVTIIDGTSGKRQVVQVAAPTDPKAPTTSPGAGIDPRLLEATKHGAIPTVAPDGTRPADAYAHPVPANGPRIAIVLGGLGIGANSTAQAIAKLPAAVTFAFTPYATDVDRVAARARAAGHEILLQVGMEPFDYPDNDPGPQTLLVSAPAEQNLDRLTWFMSRLQGYVGVSNLMGARFTASDKAFAPVLREIAKRGLIYFDDASASRSLAGQLAGSSNAPFAKADMTLDATPTPAEIDAALARLEAMAKSRGAATGFASALPVTIERIAQWVKAAQARGITLVPISMMAGKPKKVANSE